MSLVHSTTTAPDILKLLGHDMRWKILTALARSDHRGQELIHLLNEPANLVSYHLKQLRTAQFVTERRSSADGRDVYYSLDLDLLRMRYFATGEALHPAFAATPTPTEAPAPARTPRASVLFLCTHNSARSQMAEGILRNLAGDRVAVFSAGSEPATVHPEAVRVLNTMGIDISKQHSKHLDEFANQSFDYIITVCDRVREACLRFPDDPEQIHWSFADPAAVDDENERARAFELTAQQLVTRVRYLLTLIDRNT